MKHRAACPPQLSNAFPFPKAVSAVAGGTGGGYLNPSKIQSGSSVRFALLSDQPLEFYECWGEADDGSLKPFRFSEDPKSDDIEAEMGHRLHPSPKP